MDSSSDPRSPQGSVTATALRFATVGLHTTANPSRTRCVRDPCSREAGRSCAPIRSGTLRSSRPSWCRLRVTGTPPSQTRWPLRRRFGTPEIFARGDLRELRCPADVWESVTVAVGDQSGRHRTGKIVYVLQRLQHPEARPDASVVHDEVELRPIAAGVHEIVGIAELRNVIGAAWLRSVRRQSFVNADVEESRMVSQHPLVARDHLVGRIRDLFVIEAPPRKVRTGESAGRERDVVALPRVGLHVLDLPLRVIAE